MKSKIFIILMATLSFLILEFFASNIIVAGEYENDRVQTRSNKGTFSVESNYVTARSGSLMIEDDNITNMETQSIDVNYGPIRFEEVARIVKPEGTEWYRGLAFIDERMFFGYVRSSIYELDPESGEVLKSFGQGGVSLAGNNANGLLYFSGYGDIWIIDPDEEAIVGSFPVEPKNIQGLAIENGKLYATDNDNCGIYEIDIETGETLRVCEKIKSHFRWTN